jgi:cob(I)alamin adenosyltransferase
VRRAHEGLDAARRAMASGRYQLVVLDEVNVALYFRLLTVQEVLALIDEKPEGVELVLTGRRVPDEIVARADYVTEMREVRHPYRRGVQARRGIEF